MKVISTQSMGGKATAIISRQRSVARYYDLPNKCLNCLTIIEVNNQKVSEVRRKKFCHQSCAAAYNNHHRKRKVIIRPMKPKLEKFRWANITTKGQLFERAANWQSARSSIRRHAVYIFNNSLKLKACNCCGYNKHYEVAHIISVATFPADTLVSIINNIANLTALCPNCHWEFDNLSKKVTEEV